ncbi:MAG: hypothetical protein AB4426_25110 [Xenococcaceae cyanobacterium]
MIGKEGDGERRRWGKKTIILVVESGVRAPKRSPTGNLTTGVITEAITTVTDYFSDRL